VDSQYNLGQLYELGFGVSQNPAEAYKWYLIAARSGDADSKVSAARVRGLLTADARSAAERAAGAFHTGAPSPAAAPTLQAATELVIAQRALSTLGYYQGPADGLSSPALRLALAAYQRDQGLPSTGTPDSVTVTKLASLQR
jgi:localization factor PodJL